MSKAVEAYIRYITALNRAVGKFSMYVVLAMMGVLLNETIFRTIFNSPRIWTVEMGGFLLVAYYMLGGGYTLSIGGHVRMDFLYDKWSAKRKAITNAMTFCIAAVYLVVLLIVGISSSTYAVVFGQHSRTIWSPVLAPIKIIMVIGIVLMLLQVIARFFNDLAIARGKAIT